MDFMSALQRNCERRKLDPLNEELIRMTREIKSAPRAGRHCATWRNAWIFGDLRSVAACVDQADELGVQHRCDPADPIDQMRARRFDRAEKQPTKPRSRCSAR